MTNQLQCPNCGKFRVTDVSTRHLLLGFGGTSIVLGMATLIFVIGFVWVPLGVIMLIAGVFTPDNGKRKCRDCGKVFEV